MTSAVDGLRARKAALSVLDQLPQGVPDDYDDFIQLRQDGGLPLLECEMQVFGFTNPELSAEALAIWNLPESIQVGVRYQASPDGDPGARELNGLTLSRALFVADRYAWQKGNLVRPI